MIELGGTTQELILANNCLGDCSFVDRVEAAASAGFDSIGLSLPAYRAIVAGGTAPTEMASILSANGLRLSELEAIIGFDAADTSDVGVLGDGLSYTSTDDLREFWEIAQIFSPRHLQVAGSFHTTELDDRAGERFAELCDAAAAVGLALALEFVPPSNVPDARTAARVVASADRPNGGITIDSWSHTRSNGDLGFIAALPAGHIGLLQLDDGMLEPEDPDFIAETVRYRRAPGEGEFDLHGLIRSVLATGARVPISIEVMSADLNELPPKEAARRLGDGTRQVLATL